ncbi:hypothetical protein ACIODT_23490 [Streptomyces sp. NPDC088251]
MNATPGAWLPRRAGQAVMGVARFEFLLSCCPTPSSICRCRRRR